MNTASGHSTLKKLEAARQAAESRFHAPGMIPVRGFPAAASVSLAPLRYGLTETGSVTLAEEMATAVRQYGSTAVRQYGRVLWLPWPGWTAWRPPALPDRWG